MKALKGIHHVTAICGDAQRNVDFYSGLLGLRLVKKTVNFDDPGSYHLYYGDRIASPGSLLTFFAWPGAGAGSPGASEAVAMAFSVPKDSLGWWRERLHKAALDGKEVGPRFGQNVLTVFDGDGMRVELVESDQPRGIEFWDASGITHEHAIHGIHSVTLSISDEERSSRLYTGELTFDRIGTEDLRYRFAVGSGPGQDFVDVVKPLSDSRGRMGAGSIHHVAFRTDDDASQREWLRTLTQLGLSVSPVMDRNYFHSIYFREPGGVLFEIATEGPGFGVDESMEHLGEGLQLPAQYEPMRTELEKSLQPISLPYLQVQNLQVQK